MFGENCKDGVPEPSGSTDQAETLMEASQQKELISEDIKVAPYQTDSINQFETCMGVVETAPKPQEEDFETKNAVPDQENRSLQTDSRPQERVSSEAKGDAFQQFLIPGTGERPRQESIDDDDKVVPELDIEGPSAPI